MTRRTFGAASVCSGMNVSGRLGGAGGGRKRANNRHSLCLPVAYFVAWSTTLHNSRPINSMVQYHRIQRTVAVGLSLTRQPSQIL